MTPQNQFEPMGDDKPEIASIARDMLEDDPSVFDPQDPMPSGQEGDQDDE